MTDSLLIGRDRPALALRSAVERTVTSHGGLALVTGEAGIGKTALVTDAAAHRRDDLLVAFATSWESEAVPDYWLWTQVLRALRARLGEDAWRSLAPAPAAEALLGEADGSPPGEFELFDAVTQLLIAAARRGPILVVLDDLHFADAGSLELLKFACQHTWFERVLFVGTYRDSEIDPGHHLRARMLSLVTKATMISLDGLDEDGVAALVRATVGTEPDAETVSEITRRTGGNPFFVEQTAQLWASGQPVDATSAGMRDALRRRIDQLPEALTRMLTLASVGGREFHAGVMAQAAGLDVHQIEAALDAACQTRLVRRERDRYVFVHDLVRETLYNTMSDEEAAHHHGCVVRALVADESLQKLMLTTEIAHHAWVAGDDLDAEIAVDFLAKAAVESSSCLSVPGAEKHLRRALERCTPEMVARRVKLRVDLAGTVLWRGRMDEARGLYDQSLIEAEDSGDPMLLARVVTEVPQDQRIDELVRLKTLAYTSLAGEAPEAGLDHEELTRQLLYRYLLAAREHGSDEELSFGLWASFGVHWGPGTAAERQVLVEELAELTHRTGDLEMRLYSASLRWVVLLEQGDPAYLGQHSMFCALADDSDTERWRGAAMVDRAVVHMVQGDFDAAESQLDAAIELTGGDAMHDHMLAHLRWELSLARGVAPETVPRGPSEVFDVRYTDLLAGLTALRRGEIAKARAIETRLVSGPHEGADFGTWEPMWIRFEAELAVADGDAETVARLRERLAPYETEWLIALWGTSIHGPVSYWLGVLAAAEGDTKTAAAHFAKAAAGAEALEARPWAEAARKAAAELGSVPERAGQAVLCPDEAVFRRDGSTWTLVFEGRTLHLPHTKGLADLHRLLSAPGVEIAAGDLLEPDAGPAVALDARLGGDDMLDAEARARYREHLERLDEQIDSAAAIGDAARVAALDAERAALIEHLKAATGLGGRARRLGDNHERARKSVTNRIRNTLKKIEDGHPALAGHLKAAVATGSACVYRPGPDGPEWRLS
ncbi:AAA family ATPase [Glycomyces sp. NPDC046736]|uniref:ATP-binding protein n=1 Tax=Glycomyces sp. NPDC046736 TaxID=3155615 RepID=UPI0034082EA9